MLSDAAAALGSCVHVELGKAACLSSNACLALLSLAALALAAFLLDRFVDLESLSLAHTLAFHSLRRHTEDRAYDCEAAVGSSTAAADHHHVNLLPSSSPSSSSSASAKHSSESESDDLRPPCAFRLINKFFYVMSTGFTYVNSICCAAGRQAEQEPPFSPIPSETTHKTCVTAPAVIEEPTKSIPPSYSSHLGDVNSSAFPSSTAVDRDTKPAFLFPHAQKMGRSSHMFDCLSLERQGQAYQDEPRPHVLHRSDRQRSMSMSLQQQLSSDPVAESSCKSSSLSSSISSKRRKLVSILTFDKNGSRSKRKAAASVSLSSYFDRSDGRGAHLTLVNQEKQAEPLLPTPQGQAPSISPLERPKTAATSSIKNEKPLQSYADRPQLWPSPSKSNDFFRRSTSSQSHHSRPQSSTKPSSVTTALENRSKSDHQHQRPPKTATAMRRRFTNASRRSVSESFSGRKRSSTTNGRVETSDSQVPSPVPAATAAAASVSAVQQQTEPPAMQPTEAAVESPPAPEAASETGVKDDLPSAEARQPSPVRQQSKPIEPLEPLADSTGAFSPSALPDAAPSHPNPASASTDQPAVEAPIKSVVHGTSAGETTKVNGTAPSPPLTPPPSMLKQQHRSSSTPPLSGFPPAVDGDDDIYPHESRSRPSSPILKPSTASAFPHLNHNNNSSSSGGPRSRAMSHSSNLSDGNGSLISTTLTGLSNSHSPVRVKRHRQRSTLGFGGNVGLNLRLEADGEDGDDVEGRKEPDGLPFKFEQRRTASAPMVSTKPQAQAAAAAEDDVD